MRNFFFVLKKQTTENAAERVAEYQPSSLEINITKLTEVQDINASNSININEVNAKTIVEQDVDLAVKKFMLKVKTKQMKNLY